MTNTAFGKYSTDHRMSDCQITFFYQYVVDDDNIRVQAAGELPVPAIRRPYEKLRPKSIATEFYSASFKSLAKALYLFCCLGSYGDKRKMQ